MRGKVWLPIGFPERDSCDSTLRLLPGSGCRPARTITSNLTTSLPASACACVQAAGRRGSSSIVRLTAAAPAASRKLLARVALGHDPPGEPEAEAARSVRTFRSAIEVYRAAKQGELRPASYRLRKLYLLRGPYFGPLHPIGVGDITHPDVAARLSAIARGHGTQTAAAARKAISAAFRWFMEEGWTAANPVIGTRKPAEAGSREHVLTDAELVQVWNACGADAFARIIGLLILLGTRRAEVGGMCWTELDLDVGAWTLPAGRSKTHRQHVIALPPAAIEIIEAVPQTTRGKGFTSWSRGRQDLDRCLAGRVRPWRL